MFPILIYIILLNSIYPHNGIKQIPIGIVDEDETDFSKMVIEHLKKNKGIKVIETDIKDAEKQVSVNMMEAAFIITPGFKENILKENPKGIIKVIKNPASISAEMIGENVASATIYLLCGAAASNFIVEEYKKLGYSFIKPDEVWREAWKSIENQWNSPEPLMKVEILDIGNNPKFFNPVFNENLRILWGVLTAFIMFFLLYGSWWLIDEKRSGTILRLFTAPISPLAVIMGNIIFLFLLGILQVVLVIVIFGFLLGVERLPVLEILLVFSIYILLVNSIAMLASTIFSSIQLNFFIPVFSIITAVISGCFWNIDILYKEMSKISLFTPQGWVLKILNEISFGENSIVSVLPILPIMFVFVVLSVIFIYISYNKLKIEVLKL